jgi:hypothetical protein
MEFQMKININTLLTCLKVRADGDLNSTLTLVFPIVDKASRVRYSTINSNEKRMTKFIDDIFNYIYLIRYSKTTNPIQNGNIIYASKLGETVGSILYKLRCKLLHEADHDFTIEFDDNLQFGSYTDELHNIRYKFGKDLPEMLLLAVLIFVRGIEIRNLSDSAIFNIDGADIPIKEILGNPIKFKSYLYKDKFNSNSNTPKGVVTIKLDNSFIGKGGMSNNGF